MKRLLIAIGILIALGAGIYLISNKKSVNSPATQQLAANVKIYDVRTKEEFATGHVTGATLLPDYDIANGIYPDIAKDTPIAVYCPSDNRSRGATANLKKAGFTNVTDLGGLSAVKSRGYTLVAS